MRLTLAIIKLSVSRKYYIEQIAELGTLKIGDVTNWIFPNSLILEIL